MNTAAIYTMPVRADLVAVAPMYYPIVVQQRFGSVEAMCRRRGLPRDLVDQAVAAATVEGSVSHGQAVGLVVVEDLALGDPEDNIRAVFLMHPGGSVDLCAGLFSETSEDYAEVLARLDELAADPEFKGCLMAVGEFRSNPRRAAS